MAIVGLVDPLDLTVDEVVPKILDEVVGRAMHDVVRIGLAAGKLGEDKRIGGGTAEVLIAPVEENPRNLEDGDSTPVAPLERHVGIEMILRMMFVRPGELIIFLDVELYQVRVELCFAESVSNGPVGFGELDSGAGRKRRSTVQDADDTPQGVSEDDIHIPIGCRPVSLLRWPCRYI
jgi:hypothetical protein